MTVGTVFYAAPEQLMGEELDGRADQYALAATAFHLLTGSPPFHHSNPTVVISQHLTASPPALATGVPSCRRSIRYWARRCRRIRRTGSSAAWTSRGRWRTGSGWSRRPTSIEPRRRCRSPHRLTRRQTRSTANRRAEIPAPRVHRACDPGSAAAGGDRPGADPVPRDREAAERRLHPSAVEPPPTAPRRRGPTAVAADDDGHRFGIGDSGGAGRRRRLFAGGQHRHHRQRQHRLLLDTASPPAPPSGR